MSKIEFLSTLKHRLKCLPRADVERTIDYYGEIIDDKIDAGESEESAVLSIGSIDEIVAQVLSERKPKKTIAKNKQQLVILVAGAPLWMPLAIAALVIILALYITAWSLIGSLAIVEASLILAAPAGVVWGIIGFFVSGAVFGSLFVGMSLGGAGIALFALFPTLKLLKYSAKLTKVSMIKLIKAVGGR